MTLNLGVIGANRHAAALAHHLDGSYRFRVAAWAPSPGGADRDQAALLARQSGAAWRPEWGSVIQHSDIRAVLVFGNGPARTDAIVAALMAGKAVLCPVPAATTAEEIARITAEQQASKGIFLSSGRLRHTPAGRYALDCRDAFGTLHSIFAAVRLPQPDGAVPGTPDLLDEAAWDLVDFILGVVTAPLSRAHAVTGTLFGGRHDDVVELILRFTDDMIATLEMARCLPKAIPIGDAEVEIELIGRRHAVRLEPYNAAVIVYGANGNSRAPVADDPMLAMLEELVDAVGGASPRPDDIARQRRAVALMDAIRAAVAAQAAGV